MEIAAMSPPVSPQRRRDRGSGSIEPKGLTHSRKAASQPEKAVETRKPEIAAMSPPVSPQRRRDRGSGSLEPRGLTHSRKAAFLQGWKSCNVDSFSNPSGAPRHLPYPRSARQRRTLLRICPHSHRKHTHIRKHTEEDIVTFPLSTAHNRIFANFTVP